MPVVFTSSNKGNATAKKPGFLGKLLFRKSKSSADNNLKKNCNAAATDKSESTRTEEPTDRESKGTGSGCQIIASKEVAGEIQGMNAGGGLPTFCDDSTACTPMTSFYPREHQEDDKTIVSMLPGGAAAFTLKEEVTAVDEPVDIDPLAKEIEQPNTPTATFPIDLETCDVVLAQSVQQVETFWKHMNNHELERLREVCTEDYEVVFMGPDRAVNMTLGLEGVIEEIGKVFDAFPNFKFMYRPLEQSSLEEGVIVMHDFVGTGTHSGSPFGLGPCEPIEPTGKFVLLDAEEHHYYLNREGKIYKELIIPMGEMTGPMGIYILIGGFPMM